MGCGNTASNTAQNRAKWENTAQKAVFLAKIQQNTANKKDCIYLVREYSKQYSKIQHRIFGTSKLLYFAVFFDHFPTFCHLLYFLSCIFLYFFECCIFLLIFMLYFFLRVCKLYFANKKYRKKCCIFYICKITMQTFCKIAKNTALKVNRKTLYFYFFLLYFFAVFFAVFLFLRTTRVNPYCSLPFTSNNIQ